MTSMLLRRMVLWFVMLWPVLPLSAAEPALVLEKTIPLHNVSGRIDHLAFDGGRKRPMVAELGNNSVEVIDVTAGTVVHRILGLREPQGIGYAEWADIILIANAADGSDCSAPRITSNLAAPRCTMMPTISGSIRATGWQWSATAAVAWR